MKIGYLGAGSWGIALAILLSKNGHKVKIWDRNAERVKNLKKRREHPRLLGAIIPESVEFTSDLNEAISNVDMIVESVSSNGIREVFEKVKNLIDVQCPMVVTSKGIEQNTGLLFPEILLDIFGEEKKNLIGCISGPSHAEEVVKGLPTSVVCSSYDNNTMKLIGEAFNGPSFRVYPNSDIQGVSFGGAMKNIIAIACGASDGLGFGDNTKAALMTRGLHEMRKLCVTKNCDRETLTGLSGMGDLCVTCLSRFSRNYTFGNMIAMGKTPEQAKEEIGMAIEGIYSCLAALQLARKANISVPITESVHAILYDHLEPKNVVKLLLQREIKEEHQ